MTFLSLCNNSMIISIALTVLLSALIMYLMNTKISRVEKNIQKQNQALVEIVNKIKFDVNNILSSPPVISGGMPPVLSGNEEDNTEYPRVHNSKIPVSDDSDDSDESDSDSDSDDSSDSESETEETTKKEITLTDVNDDICVDGVCEIKEQIDLSNDTLKTINLTSLNSNSDSIEVSENKMVSEVVSEAVEEVVSEKTSSDSESSDDSSSDSDDEDSSTTKETLENVSSESSILTEQDLQKKLDKVTDNKELDLETIDVIKSFSNGEKDTKSAGKANLTKLKVSELKELVIDKNLAEPKAVDDMKKKELIELLKKE